MKTIIDFENRTIKGCCKKSELKQQFEELKEMQSSVR